MEGAGGTETTHDRPGAAFPQGAHPNARRRAIGEQKARFQSKRVGTNTLRRDAGVCWTWDMDMPDLPVIETQDTHKLGRKGVWRPRVALRDGSVTGIAWRRRGEFHGD